MAAVRPPRGLPTNKEFLRFSTTRFISRSLMWTARKWSQMNDLSIYSSAWKRSLCGAALHGRIAVLSKLNQRQKDGFSNRKHEKAEHTPQKSVDRIMHAGMLLCDDLGVVVCLLRQQAESLICRKGGHLLCEIVERHRGDALKKQRGRLLGVLDDVWSYRQDNQDHTPEKEAHGPYGSKIQQGEPSMGRMFGVGIHIGWKFGNYVSGQCQDYRQRKIRLGVIGACESNDACQIVLINVQQISIVIGIRLSNTPCCAAVFSGALGL